MKRRPPVYHAAYSAPPLPTSFDEEVDAIWREALFKLIDWTPWLDWLLLTKRPQLVQAQLAEIDISLLPFNVWLGTSVEDRRNGRGRTLSNNIEPTAKCCHKLTFSALCGNT